MSFKWKSSAFIHEPPARQHRTKRGEILASRAHLVEIDLLRCDLQAVVDRVYDEGGFACLIGDEKPDPPLGDEDSAWAQQLARGRST